MRDGEARGAAIGLVAQQREAVQLLIDVEIRRRLVEQQQPRAAGRGRPRGTRAAARRRSASPAVGRRNSRQPHRSIASRAIRAVLGRLEPCGRVRRSVPSARALRPNRADPRERSAAGARHEPGAVGVHVVSGRSPGSPRRPSALRSRRRCRGACSCRRRSGPSTATNSPGRDVEADVLAAPARPPRASRRPTRRSTGVAHRRLALRAASAPSVRATSTIARSRHDEGLVVDRVHPARRARP